MFERSTKIIIGISFVLFLIRLFLSQGIYLEIIDSNDFYQHIELGRNIFNELNFIVPWQLDNPITYPPLYSIVVYILTFFTKNPLVSIQYLNAFSVSFCLIPLFLVTKKLLNNISAFLAVIFMTAWFGLSAPGYYPYPDYFFTLLGITVFWLIWDVLTGKKQKAAPFILIGALISLTYSARYHGIIYCFWAIASIFFFSRYNHYSLKITLKKILCIILGFLPLFVIYHAFLYIDDRHEQVDNIATFTFLLGLKGDNEHQIYTLNPEGTEFNHLEDCRAFTVVSFCMKYPEIIRRRYMWGLKETFRIMAKCVFPFKFAKNKNFYLINPYILLILVLMAAIYYKCHPKIIYVFLFASAILFFPLYPVLPRYLMPFMPFYFILWLVGVNGLYNLFARNRGKNFKHITKSLVIILTIFLVYNYSLKFYNSPFYYARNKECPYEEYLKAASWIKNDSKNKTGRSKIMSRKTTFAYLANAYFIALPYENDWEKIINFALMKNVDYIILDKKNLLRYRRDQWIYLTETAPQNSRIRLEYTDANEKNVIMVFRIDS